MNMYAPPKSLSYKGFEQIITVYQEFEKIIIDAASNKIKINNQTLLELFEKIDINIPSNTKFNLAYQWLNKNCKIYKNEYNENVYFYSINNSDKGITYDTTSGLFLYEDNKKYDYVRTACPLYIQIWRKILALSGGSDSGCQAGR